MGPLLVGGGWAFLVDFFQTNYKKKSWQTFIKKKQFSVLSPLSEYRFERNIYKKRFEGGGSLGEMSPIDALPNK